MIVSGNDCGFLVCRSDEHRAVTLLDFLAQRSSARLADALCRSFRASDCDKFFLASLTGALLKSVPSEIFNSIFISILLGTGLALGDAPVQSAAAVIVSAIILRTAVEIVFPKKIVTGTESEYVFYVQNLRALGDVPKWPWVGYLIQSCLFFIPVAFIVYFLVKYFWD